MLTALVVLLIIALLFGAGFVVDVLWIAAVVLAVLWLVGFFARSGNGRWYRW